jgi:hypothetical protein
VASTDPQVERAAVLEGEAFLNANPIAFWPHPEVATAQAAAPETPAPTVTTPAPTVASRFLPGTAVVGVTAKLSTPPLHEPAPALDSSPQAIKELQSSYQSTLDRMVQDLESQAHFIRYAPPSFIPFHNGSYLQLSVTTTLPAIAAGSQYRMAALAFDRHITHLIRPVLAYFKDRVGFDGIDFSATVRLPSGQSDSESTLAAEFFFPLELLNKYAAFDSTGQQLIDAGFVLLNGERVSLNLQIAEAGAVAQ